MANKKNKKGPNAMTKYKPPSDGKNVPPRLDTSGNGPPALSVDIEEFTRFLDETGWSEEEKAEYVTLVWNIVCEFVALGWGVHPLQQAEKTCGELSDSGADPASAASEMVDCSYGNLIEKFVRLNGPETGSGVGGIIDE
jgi:hypothetical protein